MDRERPNRASGPRGSGTNCISPDNKPQPEAPVLLRLPDLTTVGRQSRNEVEGQAPAASAPDRADGASSPVGIISEKHTYPAGPAAAVDFTVRQAKLPAKLWATDRRKLLGGLIVLLLISSISTWILARGTSGNVTPPDAPDWNSHVYEPPLIEFSQKPWSAERPSLMAEPSEVHVAKAPERPSAPGIAVEVQGSAAKSDQNIELSSGIGEPLGSTAAEPRTGEVLSMPLEAPSTSAPAAPGGAALDRGSNWNDHSRAPVGSDAWQEMLPAVGATSKAASSQAPPASGSRYPTTSQSTWMYQNDFPESAAQEVRVGQRPEYPYSAPRDAEHSGARLEGTIAPFRDRLR